MKDRIFALAIVVVTIVLAVLIFVLPVRATNRTHLSSVPLLTFLHFETLENTPQDHRRKLKTAHFSHNPYTRNRRFQGPHTNDAN